MHTHVQRSLLHDGAMHRLLLCILRDRVLRKVSKQALNNSWRVSRSVTDFWIMAWSLLSFALRDGVIMNDMRYDIIFDGFIEFSASYSRLLLFSYVVENKLQSDSDHTTRRYFKYHLSITLMFYSSNLSIVLSRSRGSNNKTYKVKDTERIQWFFLQFLLMRNLLLKWRLYIMYLRLHERMLRK